MTVRDDCVEWDESEKIGFAFPALVLLFGLPCLFRVPSIVLPKLESALFCCSADPA